MKSKYNETKIIRKFLEKVWENIKKQFIPLNEKELRMLRENRFCKIILDRTYPDFSVKSDLAIIIYKQEGEPMFYINIVERDSKGIIGQASIRLSLEEVKRLAKLLWISAITLEYYIKGKERLEIDEYDIISILEDE